MPTRDRNPIVGIKVWGTHGEAAFLDLRLDDPVRRSARKIVITGGTHPRRSMSGYREPGHAGCQPGECTRCDVADNLPGATK